MSARTLAAVVSAIALLFLAHWVGVRNQDLLGQDLTLLAGNDSRAPVQLGVGFALLLATGIGALAVGVAWAVHRARDVVAGVGARRREDERRRVDAAHRTALEAWLHGRPDEAIAALGELLERQPQDTEALMHAADMLRSVGRVEEALQRRERLLAIEPENLDALAALAADQAALGEYRLASSTLERALTLSPKSSELTLQLREALIGAEEWEAALTVDDRLRKLTSSKGADDGAARTRCGLETRWALQQAREGRTKEAATLLRRVLKRDAAYVPAILALAEVHGLAGDRDAALEAWVTGYERTEDASILVAAEDAVLGIRHEGEEIEQAAAALSVFQRFVAASGGSAHAKAFLGKLYTRFEMVEQAAEAFEAVRTSFPDHPVYTYYAARIAEKQGRPAEAADWYRAIIKALDVLRYEYRCRECRHEVSQPVDRCPGCARWGSVGLELGVPHLRGPLPPARPVYAVPGTPAEEVEPDAVA